MSEFDNFESAEQQEADPAADFLAREQDQLAELGDEDFGFTSAAPAEDLTGGETEQQSAGGAFDPFSSAGGEADGLDGGLGGGADIGSDYMMVGDGTDRPANIPGLDDLDERLEQQAEQSASDPYASVRQVDTQRAEPEKIKLWREEQKQRLEKKDAEEAGKQIEWREQAKKELDDWYRHRDQQLDKTKKSNREGEAAFIAERDDTVPGHEWERICRLCEFNPKNSRTTKDVARMRGILLQLKQNPLVKAQ